MSVARRDGLAPGADHDRVDPRATAEPRAAAMPTALSPAGVLALQRSVGNRGVQRLIAERSLARQSPVAEQPAPAAAPEATTAAWPPAAAVKAARAAGNRAALEQALRDAIVSTAPSAVYPAGITKVDPQPGDINILPDYPDDATTRHSEVPANPGNYWRWMFWGPTSVRETEANTQGVITHELVHARQIQGWWEDWNRLPAATRDPWMTYMAPLSEQARLEGPQELEAYATGLGFLPKLAPAERRQALVGLFTAFARTAAYVPPAGVTPETTTAATAPAILTAFAASPELQPDFGDALWRALMGENPDRDLWLRVLRELEPIARAGYADAAKQPFYDSVLKRAGLTFADVFSGTTPGGSP